MGPVKDRDVGCPGIGVTGGYELYNVGAVNQIWVL